MANTKASSNPITKVGYLPSGVIFGTALSSSPSGWLLCDGAEYSETTYAELFAALSTTYNTQHNPVTGSAWAAPSSGNFRVPDYRGVFLRGVGTPNGLDAVTLGGFQDQKTKKNGLALSSDAGHVHSLVASKLVFNTSTGYQVPPVGSSPNCPSQNNNDALTSTGVTVGNGDSETRYINKGINYFIKI